MGDLFVWDTWGTGLWKLQWPRQITLPNPLPASLISFCFYSPKSFP